MFGALTNDVPRLRCQAVSGDGDGIWDLGSVGGCWLPPERKPTFLGASQSGLVPFQKAPSKPQIMSLWGLVSKMPPEKLQRLYVDFPQHLRHLLSDWLENQPW